MSVVIEIALMGLIALVPNSIDDPSHLTAYLLDANHHEAKIRILGDIKEYSPSLEGDPFNCTRTSEGFERGSEMICNLASTEISIDPPIERRQRHIKKTRPRRDPPTSRTEKNDLDWLVRMNNIEIGTGRILPWRRIRENVSARFNFGWESGQTCALDGSEEGKVKVIGFKASTETQNSLEQAVAESVLFTARVRPGPLKIQLRNEDGKEGSIVVNCSHQYCLAIGLENEFQGSGEEGHFSEYYDFVRFRGMERTPSEVQLGLGRLPEVSGSFDAALFECSLRLIRPVAPRAEQSIRETFEDYFTTNEFLDVRAVLQLFAASASLQEALGQRSSEIDRRALNMAEDLSAEAPPRSLADVFFEPLKVQDRIICPPVVMEQ